MVSIPSYSLSLLIKSLLFFSVHIMCVRFLCIAFSVLSVCFPLSLALFLAHIQLKLLFMCTWYDFWRWLGTSFTSTRNAKHHSPSRWYVCLSLCNARAFCLLLTQHTATWLFFLKFKLNFDNNNNDQQAPRSICRQSCFDCLRNCFQRKK
jgi:hypothetical protein